MRFTIGGEEFTGNVLDMLAGTNQPKRIRIQTKGPRQGDVVFPFEYVLVVESPHPASGHPLPVRRGEGWGEGQPKR